MWNFFPPRGSHGSSCYCKRAEGPFKLLVSGGKWKRELLEFLLAFLVLVKKLNYLSEKDGCYFLLFCFSTWLTWFFFYSYRYQKYCTACLPRDSQDVRNQVLWVSSFFFLFSFTWEIQACPNRKRIIYFFFLLKTFQEMFTASKSSLLDQVECLWHLFATHKIKSALYYHIGWMIISLQI